MILPGSGPVGPLGPGISLRRNFLVELADRVSRGDLEVTSRIRWLEAVPENYLGRGGEIRRALLSLAEVFPFALHSVSASLGSTDPLDKDLLKQIGSLARDVRARWFTDHLSFASADGIQFHNLLPMPFTRQSVRHVAERIKQVQDYLGIPVGIENPSYYITMPAPRGETEMSEAEFISEVLKEADCLLLLDINNVFVNAVNHSGWQGGSFAPAMAAAKKFLDSIPLQRVVEVHIAGHDEIKLRGKPLLLDTHGAAVRKEVRILLKELNDRRPVQTLLLEREMNVPPLLEVLGEANLLWRSIHPAGRMSPQVPRLSQKGFSSFQRGQRGDAS